MGKSIDLTGQRYGKLVVVEKAEPRQVGNRKRLFWNCVCDCGNTACVSGEHLRSGHTKSCGCKITDFSGEDLSGEKFGRLTVISFAEIIKSGNGRRYMWNCQCDCGKICVIDASSLKSGNTQSCGCLARETKGKASIKHGKRKTPLYNVWTLMKQRCHNETNKSYRLYGKRGIQVCDEWKDDFDKFYAWCMENGYKKGMQIDRIDTDGNYCPENCRFVTLKENENNRRDNVMIDYQGEKYTLAQFSEKFNMKYDRLRYLYIRCGLSIEEIIENDYINKPYKRNSKVLYEYKDGLYTLDELAELYEVDIVTLKSRVRGLKWDVARAIEEPKHVHCINKRYSKL